ncbi:protein HUA2-LIKE 3 isoform X3 [Juglans regia]|uniref:Glutathione peroxidase n=2 Tax=Juglans regia TaxID=51240 RepID=A0A6P9FA89_JUGRE|nr:protein HUA2-LIKE 3 isoform X3 [Juglans regia]
MPPSRRKGVSKAAAAAAARRQWKVGDLVLAKVKGFPAWPAKVGEPKRLGFTADWKKVVVHFFGTKPEQIGFCNPADVEAFTEEKKQSLLVKRQGRSADFLRAIQEIIDSYEKLKEQDQLNNFNSNDDLTPAKSRDSVDLSARHLGENDQKEASEATLNSELKTSYSTIDKNEPSLPVEGTLDATPNFDMLNKEALGEESADTAVVTETPLLTTYYSKKRSSLSQPRSSVTQTKAQRSRSSSRLESRRSQSFMMACNGGGKNAGDIIANVIPDGSLRRNKRIRKSSDVSESDDVDSAAFVSNGSIEGNSSEIATVDSDAFSLNEGGTIESGCKLEHSDMVVECLDGDFKLSKALDLQIKAVFIKKKRKPNRKRVTNNTAGPPATLDKDMGLEVLAQNASLNSQSYEKLNERCLKEDGDEHLPLVKRARVRMGKSSSVEELSCCSQTEGRTMEELTVNRSEQIGIAAKGENNNLADGDSCLVNGTLDNVSSPSDRCNQLLANRTLPWKVWNEQSFGCSVDGEAALPPSKRLHRALEAMSANAAEEGRVCNEASPTLKTLDSGCYIPHMAGESKVGNGLDLLCMDSHGSISTQVGGSGFATSLNPIILEENIKSSMDMDFCNQPVDIYKTQKDKSSKDVFPDAGDHVDLGSFGTHAVRTTVPTQSPGYLSPNIGERQANSGFNETSSVPLSSPKNEGDTENTQSSNCKTKICDKGVGPSENTGVSAGPISCFKEILKASPRKCSFALQYRAEVGASCEDDKCSERSLDEKQKVNGMCEVVKDVKHYHSKERPSSSSFSDDHLGEKDILGIRSSPSTTDAGDSLAQASSLHTSNHNMSTTDSSTFFQNNGSCTPDLHLHLHRKKTLCASLVEEEKIESAATQRPKSVGNHGEAHVALSSFEAMLGTLTRTKESIGRATRIAIDCAKFGVAAKVVEILARNLETESSLHRRVDLFFLVDSITQCSRGLKGDVGGIYPSAIQAVLPRLLSAAAPPGNTAHENRKQCLRVLRLWLERKILPESIVRHHMRELDSLSDSSSAGPYSRRSSRTERALDDPVREMEGMLVDEYGSNSSFQLPGFCMPRMLKDDHEGSDSDGESFEAVTPEHNFESREEHESIPAIKKHRHILEDVDGELEMEDVAPSCEVESSSSFQVAEVNAVQTLLNQYEQHIPLPFAPPLPQDVPPSSPPLPSSPPPPPPPPPPIPPPSSTSDTYTNGVDSQLYMDTHNIRDNLVQSVVQKPVAPRVDQTVHYCSPECRDPQMQMPESASCSFSNFSVQPVNNGHQTNGDTLRDKAYSLQPPQPAPSNQFSYSRGDQRVRPRRDVPPPSYSNRFHHVQNVGRENSYNNHERMKPPPYELHERWRFAAPFSGARYPDKGKMSYAPAPFDGPPCEPTRLPCQGWRFPPRTMNHRNSITFRPPFDGPIPVSNRVNGSYSFHANMGASQSVTEQSIHEFTVKDAKGKDVELSIYKGKVLLVVNVASKCGFTDSNYTQLTELYSGYKDKGLEILAFPCNQFLKQEPGTSEETEQFACTRYKAEYPIFQKVRCNGPNTVPLYRFLKASKTGFMGSRIKWNFTKFLVDKEGHVIERYGPTTTPLSFEADIKKALGIA